MSQLNTISNYKIDRFESYYNSIICQDLILKNNYMNIFEIPKLSKIVINTTSNLYSNDKKNIIPIFLALELITGQKPKFTSAKKSIASFKIRKNQIIGCKVSLRKKKLYNFLNIFSTIVLPKLRNFQGFSKKSMDSFENFSLGFNGLLLFPHLENHFEYFQNIPGVNINFCTNKSCRKNTKLLYSAYQIPMIS